MHEWLSDRQLHEKIILLAAKARKQIDPGARLEEIAAEFGLKLHSGPLTQRADGAFVAGDRKIVINNQVTSVERRRFTFFHELFHFLLREDAELFSYIHERYENPEDFERAIELLCNAGAAELLLPRNLVRAKIRDAGFSLSLLPEICTNDVVSAPAALIQLIQNAQHKCYGVVCEYGRPPSFSPAGQQGFFPRNNAGQLYILYATWSPPVEYAMARWTAIPRNHLISAAFAEQGYVVGEDLIPFRSGTQWSVSCEAMYFRGSAYSIFNVTSPTSNSQLSLF